MADCSTRNYNVHNKFLTKFKGLQTRWNQVWKRIEANKNGIDEYSELVSLYGEQERAYHNFVHVSHALREMDQADNLINPDQVEIAIWYHDSIYDTKSKDNEELSAKLAEKRLIAAGVKSKFVDGVIELILATKHSEIPKKKDCKYLADIDLSILGKSQPEFDKYEKHIRDEYSWVPIDQYKQGRIAVLKGFLDRNTIYSTKQFEKKYESQARTNLERAISALQL